MFQSDVHRLSKLGGFFLASFVTKKCGMPGQGKAENAIKRRVF